MAAPIAVPTIFDSANGVSMTRSLPYLLCNPKVAPNTPPFLPTSSPRIKVFWSFSIAKSCAWRIASK
ncbi:Uncharacterised protein [Streptococcus pneumoniae]|nr:Uncharacterised protein [Streptococcus pneumoniae]